MLMSSASDLLTWYLVVHVCGFEVIRCTEVIEFNGRATSFKHSAEFIIEHHAGRGRMIFGCLAAVSGHKDCSVRHDAGRLWGLCLRGRRRRCVIRAGRCWQEVSETPCLVWRCTDDLLVPASSLLPRRSCSELESCASGQYRSLNSLHARAMAGMLPWRRSVLLPAQHARRPRTLRLLL